MNDEPRTRHSGEPVVAVVAHDAIASLGVLSILQAEPRWGECASCRIDDAVACVATRSPRVVILDGSVSRSQRCFEACRRIRTTSPATNIVMRVDSDVPGSVERAQSVGALGVVARDCEMRDLLRAVAWAIRGDAYVCPKLLHRERDSELTARQTTILALLADGLDTRMVAARLNIAPETVKSHVKAATARLGAAGRPHAVALAIRRGVID